MRVFVYGTLKKGQHNHYLLADSVMLGKYRTPPKYAMYSLGYYPAITVQNQGVSVSGEIYVVDRYTLNELDRLEGHPNYYERKALMCGEYGICLTYFLPEEAVPDHAELIKDGVWPS